MLRVSWQSLGIKGDELFSLEMPALPLVAQAQVQIIVTRPDGTQRTFPVLLRLENQIEIIYYQSGGILKSILKDMM